MGESNAQKAKSRAGIKLITLILYLSDLKLKEDVNANKPITSFSLPDLILDSQDVASSPPSHR